MAKWLCACGETLRSSGDIPNPIEWLLISDQDFDAFSGLVQAEDVYSAMQHAFRGPSCGRLHVHWSGMGGEQVVYVPEDRA